MNQRQINELGRLMLQVAFKEAEAFGTQMTGQDVLDLCESMKRHFTAEVERQSRQQGKVFFPGAVN